MATIRLNLHLSLQSPTSILLHRVHPLKNHINTHFIVSHSSHPKVLQWQCLVASGIERLKPKAKQYRCNATSNKPVLFAVDEQHKLVLKVKERLEKEQGNLPTGKNRRDDEEMILWFLKDRKFNVDDAVAKLTKTLAWREEFGVDNLTEESIQNIASTGKGYLHDFPDVEGRPVVVVVAAKHFPSKHDLLESEKLCIYLIEKALSQLPPGGEKILGIFDLRGFTLQNNDFAFTKFLIDAFYYYYPKRLGQVLFVDAPFIFQPGWKMVKPWLKQYASLVRFCSADIVREEYFTPETVPSAFRG